MSRQQRRRPDFGPTKTYPRGKLNADDEGGLQIGITEQDGVIIIEFGTELRWIGMPKAQAIEFAKLIMKRAGATKIEVSF